MHKSNIIAMILRCPALIGFNLLDSLLTFESQIQFILHCSRLLKIGTDSRTIFHSAEPSTNL